jgi:CDP-diacylglycerol---serine O-phosphatidyltransferase
MEHVSEARPNRVYAAGLLVVAALIFDVMDGRVARWRGDVSVRGRELDSLADVISFGVAPACLAYAVGMTGVWDVVALLYFVACGISRLARYNVTAEALSAGAGKVTFFEGTPIPTSTLLVLLIVLLAWRGRIGTYLLLGVSSLDPSVCTRWCCCSCSQAPTNSSSPSPPWPLAPVAPRGRSGGSPRLRSGMTDDLSPSTRGRSGP